MKTEDALLEEKYLFYVFFYNSEGRENLRISNISGKNFLGNYHESRSL